MAHKLHENGFKFKGCNNWINKHNALFHIVTKDAILKEIVVYAPTFEELWERLPPYIIDNNTTYWLRLEKLKRYDRIGYFQDNDIFCENIIIEYDNSEIETITLSDLAAEMLIELKNKGIS